MLTLEASYDPSADGALVFCWIMFAIMIVAMIVLFIWLIGSASDAKRVSEATATLEIGMSRGEVIETLSPNVPFMPKNYTVDSDGSMIFIVERGGFNVVTKRVKTYFDKDDRLSRWETLS